MTPPPSSMLAILRHPLERLADPLELLDALGTLDEQPVGAGVEIKLGAAEGLIEAVGGDGVGPGDEEEVGVPPRPRRRP